MTSYWSSLFNAVVLAVTISIARITVVGIAIGRAVGIAIGRAVVIPIVAVIIVTIAVRRAPSTRRAVRVLAEVWWVIIRWSSGNVGITYELLVLSMSQ